MKTKLAHVRVNVSDIQKAKAWYESILGFENDGGWPPENPTYIQFHSAGGAAFSIMEVDTLKSYGRLNFSVTNVDELWERIKDTVVVIEPLMNTPWGTRKFTIADPDGNELGFMQE